MSMTEKSGEIDDRTLLDFLLDRLDETERVSVEERIFGQDALFEQLCAMEEELIRDYLRSQLPADQRLCFEARVKASADLRKRVDEQRALIAALKPRAVVGEARESTEALSGWLATLKQAFAMRARVYLAVAATAAVVWLAVDDMRIRTHLTANAHEGNAPASRLLSFAVSPGATLGGDESGPKRLAIPSDATLIRLNLNVPTAAQYRQFRAELIDIDRDAQVWSGPGELRSGTGEVTLEITAPALGQGDYNLRLHGLRTDGQWQDLPSYSFGVLRR